MDLVVDGFIYYHQSTGGISRLYSEILPRICDLDDSVRVTLLTEPTPPRQALPRHPRIQERVRPRFSRYLRPRRLWGGVGTAIERALTRAWQGSGRGAIWHSTYYTLPEGWQGARVVTVLDLIYERLPHLFTQPEDERFRELKRRCTLAADLVICISEGTRQDVIEMYGVPPERTRVIWLAQSEVFGPASEGDPPAAPGGRPFLLYVGGRYQYKNFGELLSAYLRWPRAGEVDLVVVSGADWSAEERRELEASGRADRVHLLRQVDDQHLARLYGQALAFVYPSLYEGFGIPLLEAMACGCPVIASDIPTTREVAGELPLYFQPGRPEELVHALETAWSEGRGSARARAGIEHARSFSWQRTAAETLDAYRSLLF